jgi:hypothetical protein
MLPRSRLSSASGLILVGALFALSARAPRSPTWKTAIPEPMFVIVPGDRRSGDPAHRDRDVRVAR